MQTISFLMPKQMYEELFLLRKKKTSPISHLYKCGKFLYNEG